MKLHVKRSISYVKSRYKCMNVKYFYLNNHMDRAKYIMIQISMIPQVFVENKSSRKNCSMGTFLHGELRGCMESHKQGKYNMVT